MSEMLITSEVASILRVSDKTVRKWADLGKLQAHRVGRRMLFKAEEVWRLLKTAAQHN